MLIENAAALESVDLSGARVIGLTAGASTPDVLVQQVIGYLRGVGFEDYEEYDHVEETIVFSAPRTLERDMIAKGMAV
jgi:4-hydroxy-3-methylbut-2-enyl diphosphate reductase